MVNPLKKLRDRLLCKIQGHKKGKRVHPSAIKNPVAVNTPEVTFACPRCGDTWSRKVKA